MFRRGTVVVSIFLSLALLTACGVSAEDAERAITDQSNGDLTEPECDKFDTDFGERTFECSAAERDGRRIKLMVSFMEKSESPLIVEWPCLSADARWKAISKHPALRCGEPVKDASKGS
jgi:hypothetical protein